MNKAATLLLALLLGASGSLHAADKDSKAPAKAATTQAAADEKIDINRAKADQLMKLDGIGEARAKAIVKARPYKGKDELVGKKVLTEEVYGKIKDKVIAKQS